MKCSQRVPAVKNHLKLRRRQWRNLYQRKSNIQFKISRLRVCSIILITNHCKSKPSNQCPGVLVQLKLAHLIGNKRCRRKRKSICTPRSWDHSIREIQCPKCSLRSSWESLMSIPSLRHITKVYPSLRVNCHQHSLLNPYRGLEVLCHRLMNSRRS